MTELPATLRDALSRPGRATPTRRAEGPVSRGDLRFARPTEGPGPGALIGRRVTYRVDGVEHTGIVRSVRFDPSAPPAVAMAELYRKR